eukprot:NODE_4499_length_1055_cov_102.625536_g4297_i0.p1 GENE.NODE_4499_length_1055_cov_102.625536_g4297_i0~~NODE_4499_length_1055_cov_102.625536_g4297_i0.p1  ORF type:complete len:304 (-),score=50.37 NODE_4499_length_1055_cov_102.625536_g4297_i0:61-972(-)
MNLNLNPTSRRESLVACLHEQARAAQQQYLEASTVWGALEHCALSQGAEASLATSTSSFRQLAAEEDCWAPTLTSKRRRIAPTAELTDGSAFRPEDISPMQTAVREYLANQAQRLARFNNPMQTSGTSSSSSSSSSNACEELLLHVQRMRQQNADAQKELEGLNEEHLQLSGSLVSSHESCQQQWSALLRRRLCDRPEIDERRLQYYTAHLDAVTLKLDVVKHQCLMDTYTPSAMEALKLIDNELTALLSSLRADEAEADSKIAAYAGCSQDLAAIVEQYAAVRKATVQIQYNIRQLTAPDAR